jgi:hypothetical protein
MASVLVKRDDSTLRLYNKGAAEWVLRRCVSMHNEYGEVVPMTEAVREDLMQVSAVACDSDVRSSSLTVTLLCRAIGERYCNRHVHLLQDLCKSTCSSCCFTCWLEHADMKGQRLVACAALAPVAPTAGGR